MESNAENSVLVSEASPAPAAKPPAPSGSQRGFYHPELDVLRFVAFFMVFLGHANYEQIEPLLQRHPFLWNVWLAILRAGAVGLTLFFVLSSYLITELLLQEFRKTGTIHFRDFYVRRILRIWPLYFFFLLIVQPIYSHFVPWNRFSSSYLIAFLLLAGNWMLIFSGVSGSIADPLFSIPIEEQFYLGWPLIVYYFRRHLPAIAYSMILASNAARVLVLVYPFGDPGMNPWANTLARLDTFALGALAAHYLQGGALNISRSSRWFLIVLSMSMLLLTGRYGDHMNDRDPITYPLESLACIVLLIAVLLPMRSWTPGPVGRIFVYLGRISYGLYVFHVMFIWMVPIVAKSRSLAINGVALVLTVGAAALSYQFLEKPFLRLKERFTYVKSRPLNV